MTTSTHEICDEDTGKSLWELYWQNPVTGEAEAFVAREGVTSGRKTDEAHTAQSICTCITCSRKWEAEQEEAEAEMKPSRFRDKVREGS